MITIKATIRQNKFYNESNGYSILKVFNNDYSTFTAIGNTYPFDEGELIELKGDWFVDKKHGNQFKFTDAKPAKPDTLEGMKLYLSSGILPGIGPSSAEKIVTYFKDKVFEILDNNPSRLLDVPGIGRKTLNKIIEVWNEKRVSPNIINELYEYGLDFPNSLKIYKMFGDDSVKYLKSKPYELLKALNTLSFDDIDRIALKHGHDKHDSSRILMGILHVFKQEENGLGNCAIDYESLRKKSTQLLKIESVLIEKVLDLGFNQKRNIQIY